MGPFLIFLGVAILITVFRISILNRLLKNRDAVKDGWNNLNVPLKHRYSLNSSSLEIIMGSAALEKASEKNLPVHLKSNFILKRILLSTLLGFIFLTDGFTQDFEVEHARIDIYINADGYFDVVENYLITFSSSKHGIYRTILTNYDLLNYQGKKEKRKIKIRKVEVPGHKFSTTSNFIQKRKDDFDIKIGSRKVEVIGEHHYEIRYRVYNAFLFEDGVIRFYWNIKSDNWEAPFKRVDFTIHPPENTDLVADDLFVYSGSTGNTKSTLSFSNPISKCWD